MPLIYVRARQPLARVSDDFNRTNGELGANWVYKGGTTYPRIVSNVCSPSGMSGWREAVYARGLNTPAQFVEADVTSAATVFGGILLRYSDAGVGVLMSYATSNVAIWTTTGWQAAGGVNQTGQVGISGGINGKKITLTAIGNTYTAYINGVQITQWTDTAGLVPQTGRLVGVGMQPSCPSLDNWIAGDLAL